jgi:hypothetical protein
VDDLRRLINGYQVSQAIHVAATLGVADLLADGARSSDELAQATGSHAPTLYRLLRALAAVGVLHEAPGQSFSLAPLGEQLREDHPQSLRGWAAFVGRRYYWNAWASLGDSVRTGENAFRLQNGMDIWSYRAEHPDENAIFDRAMQSLTATTNRALLDAYEFGRFGTVVDVGGGNGTLLAMLLAEHPAMRGILFDQPHVVANADAVLRPVADRCTVEQGSFFDAVPQGGDAYILKAIIHDWEDEDAIAILRVVRRSVDEHALLLVLEQLVGVPNEDPPAKFSDLNMLVAPGGRERTEEEFDALLSVAGFRLEGITQSAAGPVVLAAAPA